MQVRTSREGSRLRRAVASWLVLVAVVAGAPVLAAESGLRVLAVKPASAGTTSVQVEVVDPALEKSLQPGPVDPSRFHVAVEQSGGRVNAVRRMRDTPQDAYTVLAFDQSGSFARHWAQAFDSAGKYAEALQGRSRHTVSVMTFGVKKVRQCEETSARGLEDCLDRVSKLGAKQKATRLKSYIQQAVREVAEKQPLRNEGSRDVIVFTDAGDESQALSVQAVAAEARALGVRIHVVCFTEGSSGKGLARQLDEMQQLAEGSGGRYLQVEDTPDLPGAMRELAQATDHLYWLDVAFCGVKPGAPPTDRLSVEALTNGVRTHGSNPVPFRQTAEKPSTEPCEPPSAPAQPTVTAPTAPSNTTTTPPASPGSGTPGPTPSASPLRELLPWALLALALLLGVLLLVFLLGRKGQRKEEAPAVVAAPPPPAPVVSPEPEPAPPPSPAWKDPFVTLPETRLVVLRGPTGMERFYRIHKSPYTLGAKAGEVDLAVGHPAVSGHHATVQLYRNGNVFVVDERSTNGTFVDGRRLNPGERVPVQPGQVIRLGAHVELKIEQPAFQATATPASAPPLAVAPPTAPAPAAPAESPRAKMKTVYAPARGDDE